MNPALVLAFGGLLAVVWLGSFIFIGVRMSVDYRKVSSMFRWFFIFLTAGLLLFSAFGFIYRDAIFPPPVP